MDTVKAHCFVNKTNIYFSLLCSSHCILHACLLNVLWCQGSHPEDFRKQIQALLLYRGIQFWGIARGITIPWKMVLPWWNL